MSRLLEERVEKTTHTWYEYNKQLTGLYLDKVVWEDPCGSRVYGATVPSCLLSAHGVDHFTYTEPQLIFMLGLIRIHHLHFCMGQTHKGYRTHQYNTVKVLHTNTTKDHT